jgi:hypothetical protein
MGVPRTSRVIQPASNSSERIENRSHDRSGHDIEVACGFSLVRDSAASHGAVRRESDVAVTGTEAAAGDRIERLQAPDRQVHSTGTERRPVTQSAFGAALNSESAIGPTGPVHFKIVVVPAEQARRERERVAQSAVHRPHVAATGLTGKAAFEALFKDGGDTSKSTGD